VKRGQDNGSIGEVRRRVDEVYVRDNGKGRPGKMRWAKGWMDEEVQGWLPTGD